MKVVLAGVISRFLPGEVLMRAQLVEGLRRLGHEIIWVEELEPKGCVDRHGHPTDYAGCVNRENFVRAMRCFGLEDRSSQIYDGGRATVGLSLERLLEHAAASDVLFNFSGHLSHPEVLSRIPRKAYVDPDPVYTQLWHAEYGASIGLELHDVFFTRGVNIATGHSDVPDCGLTWHPITPPVVMDLWPAGTDQGSRAFTTIAALGQYQDLEWNGAWYRSKSPEFERFAGLPGAASIDVRVALARIERDPGVAEALVRGGWQLTRGEALDSVEAYLSFIRSSGAEIGITKHAYVEAETGWFSERSIQYMACGKPVLVQDTGLASLLPIGSGILTFRTVEEAVSGAQEILRDYSKHSRVARELVEAHFDYRKLVPELLERCFGRSPRPVEAAG